MEEEKDRKCIVKDKIYDFYYHGKADYRNTPAILNYHSLPNSVKFNHRNEVIFLDTKEGLELLAEEN